MFATQVSYDNINNAPDGTLKASPSTGKSWLQASVLSGVFCFRRLAVKVKKEDFERFWSKVDIRDKYECWEWMASYNGNGYGNFFYKGKTYNAMRFIMEAIEGSKLTKYEYVCHKCDNKKCVNPSHLYIGSHKQNMLDSLERVGRKGKKYTTHRTARKLDIKLSHARKLMSDGFDINYVSIKTGIDISILRGVE